MEQFSEMVKDFSLIFLLLNYNYHLSNYTIANSNVRTVDITAFSDTNSSVLSGYLIARVYRKNIKGKNNSSAKKLFAGFPQS